MWRPPPSNSFSNSYSNVSPQQQQQQQNYSQSKSSGSTLRSIEREMNDLELQTQSDFQRLSSTPGRVADNFGLNHDFNSMSTLMRQRAQDFMRMGKLDSAGIDFLSTPSQNASTVALSTRRNSFRMNTKGEPEFLVELAIDAEFTIDEIVLEFPTDSRNVTVRADRNIVTKNGVSRKNFCHQISIPDNVELGHLRLELPQRGQLHIIAPVKPPHYAALMATPSGHSSSQSPQSFGSRQSLSSNNSSGSHLLHPDTASSSASLNVQLRNSPRASPHTSPRASFNEKLFRTEVRIGHGFAAQDINVSTEGQRVKVVAVQESGGQMARNEVHHELSLPLNVDASRLVARLRPEQGVVCLEAPLYHVQASEEPLIVHHKPAK